MEDDLLPELTDHNDDATYLVVKALTGMIAGVVLPGIGSAIHELYFGVKGSPQEKRNEKSLELLTSAVKRISERVESLSPQALFNNPEFVTILLEAHRMMIRNHREEKLRAIQNCVVNSITQEGLDESRRLLFLQFLDRFTPHHFKFFLYISCKDYQVRHKHKVYKELYKEYGEIDAYDEFELVEREERHFNITICKELSSFGVIVASEDFNRYVEWGSDNRSKISGAPDQRIIKRIKDPSITDYNLTPMGLEFLFFISNLNQE